MNNLCVYSFGRLLAAMLALLAPGLADAADVPVWSEWQTAPPAKRGPSQGRGVLLYIHGDEGADAARRSGAATIRRIGYKGQLDVLRIHRQPESEALREEASVVAFVAAEIARLKQEGYTRIHLAGQGSGGWLALAASQAEGIEGVIALAPLADKPAGDNDALKEQRVALADLVARSRAKRFVLFESQGDSARLEDMPLRRALVARRAPFTFVEQTSFDGRRMAESGRFIRRYRDCIVDLISKERPWPGESKCNLSAGYPTGPDISMPLDDITSYHHPPSSPLAPFYGHWRGDDAHGAVLILSARTARDDSMEFGMGFSPSPLVRDTPWGDRMVATLDRSTGRMIADPYWGTLTLTRRPRDELEVVFDIGDAKSTFLLKRIR